MSDTLIIPDARVLLMASDGTLARPWRQFFASLVSRAGGATGGLQPASAVLDGLAALNATVGLLAQVGASAFTKRTLTGTAGNVVVLNGTGELGNPTVNLAAVAGVAGTHINPTSITVDGFGRITAIS